MSVSWHGYITEAKQKVPSLVLSISSYKRYSGGRYFCQSVYIELIEMTSRRQAAS